MKFVEIEKDYTETVSRYLKVGWEINLNTMSGSQGEWAKTDLKKDGRLIRIRLESQYHIGSDTYSIVVGECDDNAVLCNMGKPKGYQTVWNDRLVVLEKRDWVRLDCRTDWFVSEDEYVEIKKKIKERRYASRVSDIVWTSDAENIKKIAYHIVRKKDGYRGVKKSEIKGVQHRNYGGHSVIEACVYRPNKGMCESVVLN